MTEDFSTAASQFPDPFRLMIRDSAGSTNDEAKLLGDNGAADGLTLLALEQHAGRGRRGNAWFCPPGDALAFSIVVRPQEPKALWPRLALATGLAVAEAAESFGCAAGIKWPNDVWLGHRKVAGILVEAGNDFAVVGIGINVHTTDFPADIADTATSLQLASSRPPPRPEVLTAIVQRFARRRHQIGSEFTELLDAVRKRCVLAGNRITLLTNDGPFAGRCTGINDHGALLLKTPQGIRPFIQADEIRLQESS